MTTPPREGFRAVLPDALEIKERAKNDGGGRTLAGHFAVFNRWTEINSWVEGHFLERIAPGAFSKTFRETTPKVLFQHGRDAVVGDRPLGTIKELREDGDKGAYYEVDLFDTSYNNDLIPGLRAGVYGASFRFRATREEFDPEPERSDWNPEGLPLRTIREAQVSEFGPVTFPAYADATAAVRSFSDELFARSAARDPERFAQWIGTQDELVRALATQPKIIDLGSVRTNTADKTEEKPVEKVERTEAEKPEAFTIRQILDAGFSEDTTVTIVNGDVDVMEREDEQENNAPVEDAAPEGTSETRREEDPHFIKIGSLKPIPRNRKVA